MKQVKYGQEARKKILLGISKLTKAVRVTLGGEGRNVIFRSSIMQPTGAVIPGPPESTRDGVTVAREFDVDDEFEKLGVDLLKSVAFKTNFEKGDGTSTAIILAQELIENGFKEIEKGKWYEFWKKGVSPVELSDQMTQKTQDIVKLLKKQSKPVKDLKQMAQIGKIASRSEEMGKLAADVVKQIGEEGTVDIQDSPSVNTEKTIVDGLKIDNGYMSPYFATNPRKMQAEHNEANILVTDLKISTIDDLMPLFEKMKELNTEKELVIITDQIGYGVISILVNNHLKGQFKFLVVRLPGPGDRLEEFRDIAAYTGAKFVSEDTGIELGGINFDMLGHADRVVSDRDQTFIIGGGGAKKSVKNRLTQLKTEHALTKTGEDKKILEKRIGNLKGKIAVIKVGGGSEFEQRERKYMVEDAVMAIKAAMSDGVIEGGGIPFLKIARKLGNTPIDRIFKKSLSVPFQQIIKNGGLDPQKLTINKQGYDISNKCYGDMFKMGIIDPVSVTIAALENATSIASAVLITETIITDKDEKK